MNPDGMTLGQALEFFSKATGGVVLVTFIYGLKVGWWVMGRELLEAQRQLALMQARLDRFEGKDDKRTELVERTLDAVAPRRQ